LIRRITSTSREEGEDGGVVGRQETAPGGMAILVVVRHTIMTVCGQAVAVVPQHMAEPIMAMGIGRSHIVTGIAAVIATGLLLMDTDVVGILGVAVVVVGAGEVVGPVVYF